MTDQSQPFVGEAGRREEGLELPPNRSQVLKTTPLLNPRVPVTDGAGVREGLRKTETRRVGARPGPAFLATEDDRKGHLLPCGPTDPHTSVETTRAEGVRGTEIRMRRDGTRAPRIPHSRVGRRRRGHKEAQTKREH